MPFWQGLRLSLSHINNPDLVTLKSKLSEVSYHKWITKHFVIVIQQFHLQMCYSHALVQKMLTM